VSEPVSYVNAPLLAEQRGIEVRFVVDNREDGFRNVIRMAGATTSGKQISAAGTLTGPNQVQKLVEVNGYDLELKLTDHLLVLGYEDRTGIVAAFGGVLGEAKVNIAG